MAKLVWDSFDKRLYETGVKNGVLYPMKDDGSYPNGIAWNGLTAITESPSGAEATPVYANDSKYLELRSDEDFKYTIESYTYPDEFSECDGSYIVAPGSRASQQKRKAFGLSYRTTLGNYSEGNDYGYKLHLLYHSMANPSERGYATINNDPEAVTFSWEATTTPIKIEGVGSFSHVVVNSTKIIPAKLMQLESILYGSTSTEAYLPLPGELMRIITDEILDSNYESIRDSNGGILLDDYGSSGL